MKNIFSPIIFFSRNNHFKKKTPKKNNVKEDRPIFITGLKFCLYYGLIYDNRFWFSALCVVLSRIIFIIGTILFLGPIVIEKESHELPDLIILLHYAHFNVACLIMSLTVLMKSNQFKDYCKLLEDEFKFPKFKLNALQMNVMKESSEYLVLVIKLMAPLHYVASLVNVCSGPLFKGTPLPYKGWLPFNTDTWPKYCLGFFIETLVSLNVTSNLYISLQAYVIHGKQLCTQFDILCLYFKSIFDKPSSKNWSNSQREECINKRIGFAVKRHQLLMRCFNMYQEIYSGLLFVVTLESGFLICTTIFMLTDPNVDPVVIIVFILLLSAQIVSITFYCWYGQKITDRR
ncbi:hypothetical protein O3M35_008845 [Rhynocoris fuscipes]|uniref:Odorant receptor n=1 Tax=Rhynocoris fuscipes TaxID=488301 RepID=A0AAW1DDB7_9HEMI